MRYSVVGQLAEATQDHDEMRVLHSAALSYPSPGIKMQMTWEQEAADSLGLSWDARLFCVNGPIADLRRDAVESIRSKIDRRNVYQRGKDWWKLRWGYHEWLLGLQSEYEVFLLRYSVHDPFQWRFVRKVKKPVYFVHHSLEKHELRADGKVVGRVRSFSDTIIGKYTLSRASGIVGVTNEIINEELSRVSPRSLSSTVYPNGIVYTGDVAGDARTDIPEFLFVAGQFDLWHGLDLLLASIRENDDQFILHLVGNVPDRDLVHAENDSRVQIHGRLSNDQIRNIGSSCTVGLSSFALHRNKMQAACPLKVREYLTLGLPVYSGHDDVFPKDFPYFKKGAADIGLILEFATRIAKPGREDVAGAARPYIDKTILLRDLAYFLQNDSEIE